MIPFACWACGQAMEADDAAAGQMRPCPSCGQGVRVPKAGVEDRPALPLPLPGRHVFVGLAGLILVVVGTMLPAVWLDTGRLRRAETGAAVTRLPYGMATKARGAEAVSVATFALPGVGPGLLGGAAAAFVLVLGRRRLEALAVAVGLLIFTAAALGTAAGEVDDFQQALRDAGLGDAVGALRVVWAAWVTLLVGAALLGLAGWLAPTAAEAK
jgi:hypothetical protein